MDPPAMPDYYADLGVENNATVDKIKKAHRKLVLQVHPDRQAPGTCSDAHAFRKVRRHLAYSEILSSHVQLTNTPCIGAGSF